MVNFILDSTASESVRLGVYEIGLRLGYPFTITRGARTSSPSSSDAFAFPITSNDQFQGKVFGVHEISGKKIWARSADDREIVPGLIHLLTFEHEKNLAADAYDGMKRIRPQAHPLNQAGAGITPVVENAIELLRERLTAAGFQGKREYPWGERAVICLTHDVDGPSLQTPFAIARSFIYTLLGNRFEREAFGLGVLTRLFKRPDPYWNFKNWTEFERTLGIHSTYFFYPGPTKSVGRHRKDPHYNLNKSAALKTEVSDLIKANIEIGVHGSIHSGEQNHYSEARDFCEKLTGGRVTGYRGHYWGTGWDKREKFWDDLHKAGYGYDMSLSMQSNGWRAGTMFPHSRQVGQNFLGIPTALMDAYTSSYHNGKTHEESTEQINAVVDAVEKHHGLLVLDWHERAFANVGAWRDFMYHLIRILKRARENPNFTFMRADQLTTAWNEYARKIYTETKAEKRPETKAEKRPETKAEKRPETKAEKRPETSA